MKKYILILASAALALVSCDLDKQPLSQLSPDSFFSNRSELEAFSNDFYTIFPEDDIYNEENDLLMHKGLTNEMRGGRSVPASGGGWSFTDLRNYNTLIELSANCKDEGVRNEFIGVARFFRAYYYLIKVQRFGDYLWYDHQVGSADEELYKTQDSREMIMANVVADLDFAIDNLPVAKNTYKVTKWTALALKSRACLFEGTFRKYHNLTYPEHSYQWYLEQAASAAEEFIQTSGYGIYTGAGIDGSYRQLFESENAISTEIVLARDYDFSLAIKHNATYNALGQGTNLGMTKKMINSYLMKDGSRFTDKPGYETMSFIEECRDRDPRLAQTIRTPGYIRTGATSQQAPNLSQSETGYQVTKYVQGVDCLVDLHGASYNDLPLFRAAEVYLNFAEAKAELGTLTQGDLNISIKPLRDRVGMPNIDLASANQNPDPYLCTAENGYPNVTGANKGVILEIRRERQIELYCENFRYYDLMRWKNGQAFTHPFLGMYFTAPGTYDLDGNGTMDVCIYKGTAPTVPSGCVLRKIDEEIFFTEGDHGYIWSNKSIPGIWDENRDYFYPVPTNEISLSKNNLKQNPGW